MVGRWQGEKTWKLQPSKKMHDMSMVGGRQIKGIISNNEVMKLKQQENAFDTFKIGQTFATTTPYIDLIWFCSRFQLLSFFTKFGRCVDFLPKQRISIRGGCLTLFWLPSIQSYFSDETCLPNSAFSVLSSWNFYQKRRNACSLLCE